MRTELFCLQKNGNFSVYIKMITVALKEHSKGILIKIVLCVGTN